MFAMFNLCSYVKEKRCSRDTMESKGGTIGKINKDRESGGGKKRRMLGKMSLEKVWGN